MRALVIGGGIGGLAAALALKRTGHDVHVYEQAPQIQEVGAGLSLWSNAINALSRLGVAEQIKQLGTTLRYGRVYDNRGTLLSTTDLHDYNPHVPCVMIHRGDLQRELLETVGRDNVTTDAKCIAVSQTEDSAQVSFANGSSDEADCLVGADGIHSVVRSQLFGESELRYSGRTCWRGIADFDPPDLDADSTTLVLGPGFQMGMMRCGPGRVYWFFAIVRPAGGNDNDEGPKNFLLNKLGGGFSLPTSILQATEDARVLRGDLYDRPPAWPWGVDRITLLGDAIHSTTPNLGQGACQAIESAVFLADSVNQHAAVEAALRHYEQRRRKRTAMVTKTSWQSGKFLTVQNPLLLQCRNLFLRSPLGKPKMRSLNIELLTQTIPELTSVSS